MPERGPGAGFLSADGPRSSDRLRGLGTANTPEHRDVAFLALTCLPFLWRSLGRFGARGLFSPPSRSLTVMMTEKMVLFHGARRLDHKAPPAPRRSQKGSFLEGKFSQGKRRRKPEEGEMKGRYIRNSGTTQSETTEVNGEGEVQPVA